MAIEITRKDTNDVVLHKNGQGELHIGWSCETNDYLAKDYWFSSYNQNFEMIIDYANDNERDVYRIFYTYMKDVIGSYYLKRLDYDKNIYDIENKIITVKSDPIEYEDKTYEGATLKLQCLKNSIVIKLTGNKILKQTKKPTDPTVFFRLAFFGEHETRLDWNATYDLFSELVQLAKLQKEEPE